MMTRTKAGRATTRGASIRTKAGVRPLRRTTIVLPADLRRDAMAHAKRRDMSLAGLIRSVLFEEIEGSRLTFLDREIVFRGKPARGAPGHHDDIYA